MFLRSPSNRPFPSFIISTCKKRLILLDIRHFSTALATSKKPPLNDDKRDEKYPKIAYFDLKSPSETHRAPIPLQSSNFISQPPSTSTEILSNLKLQIIDGFSVYAKLSKMRLATLVLLTTMAGYSISPSACLISSPWLLLATSLGTSLCITSANTINQLMEIEHDAKMTRTRLRILPSGKISKNTAWSIGVSSGIAGTLILYEFVNPMTAILGLGNILIYTAAYTRMKRTSVWNTHVGSLVGAIPPLMGWTAINGGHILGDDGPGGLLMALILFAWQFPHFNALSHNIRHEYLKAGYKMMANVNPDKNAAISLRWAGALFPISAGLSISGITTDAFILTSAIPNGYIFYYAYKFWKESDEKARDKNAKKLFMASLFHLPAIIVLMLVHKRHWFNPEAKPTNDGKLDTTAILVN